MTPFADLTPPYSTIVADPPWGYEKRSLPWSHQGKGPSYSLMALDDIKALPVADLAAEDAHLYLWAVLPMLAEAVDVVRAWGFQIDTALTWCKPGPGLGAGFRGNTEHLLVARRGFTWENPTCAKCRGRVRGAGAHCQCDRPDFRYNGEPIGVPKRSFSSVGDGTWYTAPRASHSEKPPLFLDLVERMSPGPYLELFARNPRLGWDSWGNGYELGEAS